jgi:Cd2+/Zn2+-exporting ATPase
MGEPTIKVTELVVTGMCCQSEVTLIQKKLGPMEGVIDLKFNLMLRRVAVYHDPSKVSAAQMLRPLNWALLGASVVQKGGPGAGLKRGEMCSKETILAVCCLVLFLIGQGVWARPKDTEFWEWPYSYFSLACVLLGLPTLVVRALNGLFLQCTLNMFASMALACIGALVLLDLEEAAAITFFFLGSEWLQAWCVHHTANLAGSLGGMLPERAYPADGSADKPLSEVVVGELLLVKPGGAVPADGDVVGGASSVDESMLTGESIPVSKAAGAQVFAGTTNQTGVLTVRVVRLPAESTAAQLGMLVAQAQRSGGREVFLERFARVYTTLILLTAILLATIPLGWCTWTDDAQDDAPNGASVVASVSANISASGHGEGGHGEEPETWTERWMHTGAGADGCVWWLHRALALVVISCPCSFIVAMPVTNACGISALAKWGILVKNAKQLDLLARMTHLAVDKTGTLTEGRFRLRQLALNHANRRAEIESVMRYAAAVEKNSSHPIAAAFLEFADSLGVDPPPAPEFMLLEGEGIEALVEGVKVHVGNERLARRVLAEAAIARGEVVSTPEMEAAAEALRAANANVAHAQQHQLPARMLTSLQKKQQQAQAALEAATEAARCAQAAFKGGAYEAAADPLPPCPKDCGKCRGGGCGPKECCNRRGLRRRRCGGRCCHRDCCNPPRECCHDGPCPTAELAPTTTPYLAPTPTPAPMPQLAPEAAIEPTVTPATAPMPSPPPSPPVDGPPELTLGSSLIAGWRRSGSSVLWVLLDGEIAAACQLSDAIRGETAPAMAALAGLGVKTTILTGDCEETAQAVRAQAGIATAVAGMKPAEKLAMIKEFRREAIVGMVGDGVNDGPALAAADVGIAMGVHGTALASAAAGVVLMTNDLRRLADGIMGARRTARTLRNSVAIALLLKLLPLVLIFTAFEKAEGYLITASVGSDVLGIIIVLANAISLLGIRSQYAVTPCANSALSMEGPTVVTSTTE